MPETTLQEAILRAMYAHQDYTATADEVAAWLPSMPLELIERELEVLKARGLVADA